MDDQSNFPNWLNSKLIESLVKDVEGGATPDSVLQVYISNSFTAHIISSHLKLHEWYHAGTPKIPATDIQTYIDSLDLFLIHRDMTGRGEPTYYYVGEDLTLKYGPSSTSRGSDDEDGDRWVEIMTCNAELMDELKTTFKTMMVKKPRKGSVYALVAKASGLEFASMGVAGSELVRDNYSAEVLEAYDQIVSDLKSNEPSGRLSIIDGPAGTGKTHMVRGLLTEVRAMFVMIAPEAVTELASPQIIPLLIDTREEHHNQGGQPIIFILEDADSALVPRDISNMSIISSLLNYTDGIFGTLFDLRVIATTNAKNVEIEPALKRAGRLSCQVTVGELSAKEATTVYQRLTEGRDPDFMFNEPTRLADIYAKAHGFKTTKEKGGNKEPSTLGFR